MRGAKWIAVGSIAVWNLLWAHAYSLADVMVKHDEAIQVMRETTRFVPASGVDEIDQLRAEARINLQMTCTTGACANDSVTLKPRATGTHDYVTTAALDRPRRFDFLEAYAKVFIGQATTISGGKELVGWGPGLLFSPTNRLFPDNGLATPRREIPGKRMIVGSEMLPAGFTLEALAARADDADWDAAGDAKSKFYLIRLEHQGGDLQPTTLGIVAAGGSKYRRYGGLYFQILLNDAWTFGTEWSASRGYARDPEPPIIDDDELQFDGLVNLKYGLESGGELAAELAMNGFAAPLSLYARNPQLLLPLLPGAPLPATPRHPLAERYYVLLQARLPRLGNREKTTVFSRLLWAPEGRGGMVYAEWSYGLHDRGEVFVGYSHTFGDTGSTFRLLTDRNIYVGMKLYL